MQRFAPDLMSKSTEGLEFEHYIYFLSFCGPGMVFPAVLKARRFRVAHSESEKGGKYCYQPEVTEIRMVILKVILVR
jgi:hypothetical protein